LLEKSELLDSMLFCLLFAFTLTVTPTTIQGKRDIYVLPKLRSSYPSHSLVSLLQLQVFTGTAVVHGGWGRKRDNNVWNGWRGVSGRGYWKERCCAIMLEVLALVYRVGEEGATVSMAIEGRRFFSFWRGCH